MDANIRSAVMGNLKGSDATSVFQTIQTAIDDQDELTLPGLGVMFELFWKNIDHSEQQKIATTLSSFFA